MKCKNCRGTGERHKINWETGKVYIVQGEKCPVCGGKGEIVQTNEEWLCVLPMEKKAKVLRFLCNGGDLDDIARAKYYSAKEVKQYMDWLREKHE